MRLSVALCTYNGAQYIREQLHSILQQSMAVDEIIICDDGSSDNTVKIIRTIASTTPILVHVHINKNTIGVKRNFKQAIELCTGDYVFLSDQDDVWMPNKVERIMEWFKFNPGKSVVFTDAYLINADGKQIGRRTQFQGVGFRQYQRQMFLDGHGLEVFMMANRATGATMAFRRAEIPLLEDDWGQILHDEYIAVKALIQNKLGIISVPLIEYRQHEGQQIGSSCSDQEIENVYSDWNFYDPAKSMSHIKNWKFELTPLLSMHISMLEKRDKMRHSSFGWLQEIATAKDYWECYGKYMWRYVKADARKTAGFIWHKLILK